MATLHKPDGTTPQVPPTVGAIYLWFSTSRRLLVLTVRELHPGAVILGWKHFQGLVAHGSPQAGEVVWTRAEWDAADLYPYEPPVQAVDLQPGEEVCRSCHGTRWETERDFDLLPCIWCGGTGRQIRRERAGPGEVRRGELYPAVRLEERG